MPRAVEHAVEIAVVGVHELDAIAERARARRPRGPARRRRDRGRGRATPRPRAGRGCGRRGPPCSRRTARRATARGASSVSATSTGSCSGGHRLRSRTRRGRARRRRCRARAAAWRRTARGSRRRACRYWPNTSTSPAMPAESRSRGVDHDASLDVDLRRLAVVVDAVEILEPGRVRGGHARELFFKGQPDRHGVQADVLPRQARHEHLRSVLLLDEGTEGVRDLEPPFVINFGGVVAPKHVWLLHFAPQKSTGDSRERLPPSVNRKIMNRQSLRLIFARRNNSERRPLACYDVQIWLSVRRASRPRCALSAVAELGRPFTCSEQACLDSRRRARRRSFSC